MTEQLFDAALGELSVLAREQPCMLVGDFNVEPPKPLAWQRRFRLGSGLTSKQLGPGLLVCNLLPLVSVIGVLVVVIVGTLWSVVPLLLLLFFPARFSLTGGLLLILLLGLSLTAVGGPVGLRNPCSALPSGLLLGGDKNRSKSFEVQWNWEIHYEHLQFMSRLDAVQLDDSLGAGDVSRAWLVWSGAAEVALADAVKVLCPLAAPFLGEGALCSGLFGLVGIR